MTTAIRALRHGLTWIIAVPAAPIDNEDAGADIFLGGIHDMG
jgi:hypothetical protein